MKSNHCLMSDRLCVSVILGMNINLVNGVSEIQIHLENKK